ncbi:hypothetical protein QTH91_13780 [Variovorax dokdonensis]|uniref:DUF2486 domain-containing protein n=1 Tax=Variovorax dokdonensis TaxID=344883 RepID=A0ABT7NC99_9BURK|nr:hypothetical protein [Variovorax dokdonensis]MDM0045558.1 hypothetical protein [Variovorax dokdonensis]
MSAPNNPGRTPPRFVPTLTTVVELPEVAEVRPPVAPPPAPAETPAQPPQVATPQAGAPLLDDFDFSVAPAVAPGTPAPGSMVAVPVTEEEALRLEEHLLHRVLQRVDLSLEARLTDTVSAAVQTQLDAMLPRLRSQIEDVLRAVVIEALAQELSETPGSAGPSGPAGLG